MSNNPDRSVEAQRLRAQIEYWKHVVSVLMHFNDMCIRTRWFGLTVLTTLFAGAAVAIVHGGVIHLVWLEVPIASLMFAIAALVSFALWQLDERYYFKMLVAAVEHAMSIEPKIKQLVAPLIPDLCLTEHISSKVTAGRAQFVARWFYGAPFFISLLLLLLSLAYGASFFSF